MNKKSIAVIAFSCVLLAFAYATLLARVEPFMYQFYLMAWWAYICFLDAVLAGRTGRFLVLNRGFPFLVVMSAAFWCIFEAMNVRLQNWFYINVPGNAPVRYIGYLLAYGTVIPAIYLTHEAVDRMLPAIKIGRIPTRRYGGPLVLLGALCLACALLFPTYCFALAWVFLAFMIDGWCYRTGRPSFTGDLEQGNVKPLVAAGVSGMVCGVLWEFWNYRSVTKWVYTVPFFEDLKIFEMPAPGFLGFAFFAVEVMAFLRLLGSRPRSPRSKRVMSAAALAFCCVVFVLIDRYTVFSRTARADELTFLGAADRATVEATGAHTSFAVDPRLLTNDGMEKLALLHLKGLGPDAFVALERHGISTIDGLAALDEKELSSILKERNMRRIRVYLKASRNAKLGIAKQEARK